MKLVILFYFVIFSNKSIKSYVDNSITSNKNQISIKCILCHDLFKYDFDYDKLLKEMKHNNDIELVAKEISMQYFFKGGDIQFEGQIPDGINFNNCKLDKLTQQCEKLKAKLCENVLSLKIGSCNNQLEIQTNKDNILKFQNSPKSISENINTDSKTNNYSPTNPPNNISFFQLTPEYISQNFDSTPKSHWQPPKPVLLQNFQTNIGDQLNEISLLSS